MDEKKIEPNKELQEWADAQMEALMKPMSSIRFLKWIGRSVKRMFIKKQAIANEIPESALPLFRCNKCNELNFERQTTFTGTLKCAVCGRKYPDGGGSGWGFFPPDSVSDWLLLNNEDVFRGLVMNKNVDILQVKPLQEMTIPVCKVSSIIMTPSGEFTEPLATISVGANRITGFLKSEIQFVLPDLKQKMTVDVQDIKLIDVAGRKSPKDPDVSFSNILDEIAESITPEAIKEAGEKAQQFREAIKEVYVSDDDVEEEKRRTEITRQKAERESIKAGKIEMEPEEQLPFEERLLRESEKQARKATAITDSVKDLIKQMNENLKEIDKDQYPELYEKVGNVWMNIIMGSGEK